MFCSSFLFLLFSYLENGMVPFQSIGFSSSLWPHQKWLGCLLWSQFGKERIGTLGWELKVIIIQNKWWGKNAKCPMVDCVRSSRLDSGKGQAVVCQPFPLWVTEKPLLINQWSGRSHEGLAHTSLFTLGSEARPHLIWVLRGLHICHLHPSTH